MDIQARQLLVSLSPAVVIDSIYKVTEGRQSEIFHRHAEGNFDPSCCFTIYHGSHMESLDLITSNPEEARTWITGLKYLMAGISDEDSLAKRQRTHDQYPFMSLSLCFWLVFQWPQHRVSFHLPFGDQNPLAAVETWIMGLTWTLLHAVKCQLCFRDWIKLN